MTIEGGTIEERTNTLSVENNNALIELQESYNNLLENLVDMLGIETGGSEGIDELLLSAGFDKECDIIWQSKKLSENNEAIISNFNISPEGINKIRQIVLFLKLRDKIREGSQRAQISTDKIDRLNIKLTQINQAIIIKEQELDQDISLDTQEYDTLIEQKISQEQKISDEKERINKQNNTQEMYATFLEDFSFEKFQLLFPLVIRIEKKDDEDIDQEQENESIQENSKLSPQETVDKKILYDYNEVKNQLDGISSYIQVENRNDEHFIALEKEQSISKENNRLLQQQQEETNKKIQRILKIKETFGKIGSVAKGYKKRIMFGVLAGVVWGGSQLIPSDPESKITKNDPIHTHTIEKIDSAINDAIKKGGDINTIKSTLYASLDNQGLKNIRLRKFGRKIEISFNGLEQPITITVRLGQQEINNLLKNGVNEAYKKLSNTTDDIEVLMYSMKSVISETLSQDIEFSSDDTIKMSHSHKHTIAFILTYDGFVSPVYSIDVDPKFYEKLERKRQDFIKNEVEKLKKTAESISSLIEQLAPILKSHQLTKNLKPIVARTNYNSISVELQINPGLATTNYYHYLMPAGRR